MDENNFIETLKEMDDDSFFNFMVDFIDDDNESDFEQDYPGLYRRYQDILDKKFYEDDDEEDKPTFRDLYMKKDIGPTISAPSFTHFEQSLKIKPLGGIFSGNAVPPVGGTAQIMRNGGFISKYVNGGNVSPLYSEYMAVGNSKKISGIVPTDSMIPIQTEIGELIVHPTMDVTTVNAKKRHSKLDPDEVTDIVPEGSYVLSRHGVVRIYKDEANKAVIETQNKPYNLFSNNPQPKVKTLGDMMKRKEMAPAELAGVVLNKYKTVNHDDPFTDQTNKANKYNSSRYIRSIIELSEFDKARKGIGNGESMNEMFSQIPDQWSQNGGYQNRRYYQDWGAIAKGAVKLLPAITSVAGSLFGNRSGRKTNQQAQQLSQDYARQYQNILGQSNRLGFMSNAASTLAQDPTVQVAKRDSSYIQGLLNRIGATGDRGAFMQDLASTSPDLSKMDPRAAGALGSQLWGNQLRAVSNFNTSQAAANREARDKYTGMLADNEFFNRQQDVSKSNQETMNRNRLAALLGSQASGFFGTQGEIDTNALATRVAGQKDFLANEQKRKGDLWTNLSKSAQLLDNNEVQSMLGKLFGSGTPANTPAPGTWFPPMAVPEGLTPDPPLFGPRQNGGLQSKYQYQYPNYFYNR